MVKAREDKVETPKAVSQPAPYPGSIREEAKIDTIKEAAARIANGEKVRHPGPWVEIVPKDGRDLEQEIAKLQAEKKLKGFRVDKGSGKALGLFNEEGT